MAVKLEGEFGDAVFGEVRSLALRCILDGNFRMVLRGHDAYQVQNASRLGLVFHALSKEQQAFSGLSRIGGVVMSKLRFFYTKVACQMLLLDGFVAKPEVFLGEAKALNKTRRFVA